MDEERDNYNKIKDLRDEINDMRINVLGNINFRLIKNEELARGLDERLKIFVPKRNSE